MARREERHDVHQEWQGDIPVKTNVAWVLNKRLYKHTHICLHVYICICWWEERKRGRADRQLREGMEDPTVWNPERRDSRKGRAASLSAALRVSEVIPITLPPVFIEWQWRLHSPKCCREENVTVFKVVLSSVKVVFCIEMPVYRLENQSELLNNRQARKILKIFIDINMYLLTNSWNTKTRTLLLNV